MMGITMKTFSLLFSFQNLWVAVVGLNRTTCNRFIPQEGTWMDRPPYWTPRGCPTQKFSTKSTIKCMKGRTLYVIGNSVARQSAFEMVNMLGGGSVKREGQRDLCPKHETTWDDSCHTEFAGVKIRFLHVQWIDGFDYANRGGFPFIRNLEINNYETVLPAKPSLVQGGPTDYWEAGNCIDTNMFSCLQTFFNGSTERDVLVFQVGMSYSATLEDKVVNTKAWARASAANFKANLKATFPGKVFRHTGEQMLGGYAAQSERFRKLDDILWEVFQPNSEPEDQMWYTIDQWAINKGRNHLYNDDIHFVGPLNSATVHQVLNMLCPGGGEDADPVLGPDYHKKLLIVTDAPGTTSTTAPLPGAEITEASGNDHEDGHNSEGAATWVSAGASGGSPDHTVSSDNEVALITTPIVPISATTATTKITTTDLSSSDTSNLRYYVDKEGFVHLFEKPKKGTENSCFSMLQNSGAGVLSVAVDVVDNAAKAVVFPDVCQEGMLLQSTDSSLVYIVQAGQLRGFWSITPFVKMGLDFSDVKRQLPWVIDALPKGDYFY